MDFFKDPLGFFTSDFLRVFESMASFFRDPSGWLKKQLLKIVELFFNIIFDIIEPILKWIYDLIVNSIIKTSIEIFDLPEVGVFLDQFVDLGIGLLFICTAYELIKSLFNPIGIDADKPLNILITFIVIYILINLTYYISFTVINIQDSIIQSLTQLPSFNPIVQAYNYGGAGSFTNVLEYFAKDVIKIFLLVLTIFKMIDLGSRFVMRVVLILILVLIGPIAIAMGVIKSQRNIMGAWYKALIGSNLTYIIMVFAFIFTFDFMESKLTGEPDIFNILFLVAFIFALDEIEGVLNFLITGGKAGSVGDTVTISSSIKRAFFR